MTRPFLKEKEITLGKLTKTVPGDKIGEYQIDFQSEVRKVDWKSARLTVSRLSRQTFHLVIRHGEDKPVRMLKSARDTVEWMEGPECALPGEVIGENPPPQPETPAKPAKKRQYPRY